MSSRIVNTKSAFAARLHEICEEQGLPLHGRQVALGQVMKVSQTAARKWLTGAGFPEVEKGIELARWGNVNFEWLMTGRGPKRGATIDTKALVLGEAIDAMPETMREQVLDYFRYKIETSSDSFIAQEQVARYVVAINAYKAKH
ncbi:MAG: hypothetical protein RL341_2135 [Pseudomonadota bacterium]|jgi:hypothetical protein